MTAESNSKKAPVIAVLGTGSDVGKSIITTVLCRFFTNCGMRVAPYKAQNMSNNSGVTPEGLEMGRAQIVQAEAAGIPPHVDMNPILLKPTSDVGSQVVLLGEAKENCLAGEYHRRKEQLFSTACEALDRLRENNDLVVMEGAGSCAEVNLMEHDIVNLRMAEYAEAPVILVGDIHRGGIFAQLVGTLSCLSQEHQDMIKGFVINRFRGDMELFRDGSDWIEHITDKKVFGVMPWFKHFQIEAEDSVVIENPEKAMTKDNGNPSIAVIRIPHISNFTDFDPLIAIKDINIHFLEKVQDLSSYKAVIIPGSKNTRFDLQWIKDTGWADKLDTYFNNDGHILGICGGYQMLGQSVHDPDGLEGNPGTTEGLSLLPLETFLQAPKTTTLSKFTWQGIPGTGYEIHMGHSNVLEGEKLFDVNDRNGKPFEGTDGCIMHNGRVIGTYMHGLFDAPDITRQWLSIIGLANIPVAETHGPAARDKAYDQLAEHFEKNIDIEAIKSLLDKD